MYKMLLIALCVVCCVSCSKQAEFKGPATGKVAFATSVKTPSDFDNWTFFWRMPEVDKDAQLAYVVSCDKKEYYTHVFPKHLNPGSSIRSDFNNRMFKWNWQRPCFGVCI